MSHSSLMPSFLKITVLAIALVSPSFGQEVDEKPAPKIKGPALRIICAPGIEKQQKIVIATRNEQGGALTRLSAAEIRASFITEWLPAKEGEIHLALRENGSLKSIGHFEFPAETRRILVFLVQGKEKDSFETRVIDPDKTGFVVDSTLIVNFSGHEGLVSLGKGEEKVSNGQSIIAKAAVEENGMFHMTVAYLDAEGKSNTRYDRYVSQSQKAREIVFLLADPTMGLKVGTLTEFGPFE